MIIWVSSFIPPMYEAAPVKLLTLCFDCIDQSSIGFDYIDQNSVFFDRFGVIRVFLTVFDRIRCCFDSVWPNIFSVERLFKAVLYMIKKYMVTWFYNAQFCEYVSTVLDVYFE